MFNKEQLKYLLETTRNINYENFYKTDLITMIKILQEKIDELKHDYNVVIHEATEFESKVYELQDRINKAIEIIESYNLGKYDFNIPSIGIIELLEILKGSDK